MPICGTMVPHAIYLNWRESCVGSTYYYVLGQGYHRPFYGSTVLLAIGIISSEKGLVVSTV